MITHSKCSRGVGSIIDVEMVVTVNVEPLKLDQELLQDTLRLEGDDTVLVPLVPAIQHHAVHRPGYVGHEGPSLGLTTHLAY